MLSSYGAAPARGGAIRFSDAEDAFFQTTFARPLLAQIEFARVHWARLEQGVQAYEQLAEEPDDGLPLEDLVRAQRAAVNAVWAEIQAFLNCAANVSKILWPPNAQDPARASRIRVALGVADEGARSRDIRNALEHLDEALDVWIQSTGNSYYADLGMLSEGQAASIGLTIHRNFDRASFVVSVEHKSGVRMSLPLRPLMASLEDLSVEAGAILGERGGSRGGQGSRPST